VTRVLAVASEIYPVIKTGGLADVVGALPAALKAEGIQTRTLVPGYPAVLNALQSVQVALDLPHFHGGAVRVLSGSCAGIDLFVLDAAYLFGRPGNPYTAPDGADWPDNALRYAALGRVAAAIGQGAIAAFVPDIVHAHDWQAGLTHAYLAYSGRSRPGTVMTVHNLAYQGQFPQALLGEIGLPPESFSVDGVEYYGSIGYLKAGLRFADRITTVSPTYAREIQQPAEGMGLDGLLRGRSDVLSGILNGIDISVWDPATDPSIASDFDAERIERRAPNKAALQRQFGLRVSSEPLLLGVISRLSWQKGLDLLLQALPEVLSGDVQIAVLGSGDADLQDGYRAIAAANPDRAGVRIGYDENLAHLIQAGADALVVPSRFEPCGLTQLCALRYGAVPIVSDVGGLADTVLDADVPDVAAATGIKFGPVTPENLSAALRRASVLFQGKSDWLRLQRNGMAVDVSWRNRAGRYAGLYRDIIEARRGS
jgi:starch synthase